MKKYTNEELCHLIAQPCNNTAKAELFKRIKFADECLKHKAVFYVPTQKYLDGVLVDVDYNRFVSLLLRWLDVKGYYVAQVTGSFKERLYPEKQVTVFLDDKKADRVDYVFKHIIALCHDEMQQESYAYELDDNMHVISFDNGQNKEEKEND